MFKKYLRNISMFFLCIFATFVYFKNDDVKKEAKATKSDCQKSNLSGE